MKREIKLNTIQINEIARIKANEILMNNRKEIQLPQLIDDDDKRRIIHGVVDLAERILNGKRTSHLTIDDVINKS